MRVAVFCLYYLLSRSFLVHYTVYVRQKNKSHENGGGYCQQNHAAKIPNLWFRIGISMFEKPCERIVLLFRLVMNNADST